MHAVSNSLIMYEMKNTKINSSKPVMLRMCVFLRLQSAPVWWIRELQVDMNPDLLSESGDITRLTVKSRLFQPLLLLKCKKKGI